MRAIVLAAGYGTRFKSEKPKVIHSILGKPMLWYVLNTVKSSGIENIGVVVGYKAQEVKESLGEFEDVVFFHQKNPRGGTADAVMSAIDMWRSYEGYVLVINGDSPLVSSETLKQMQRYLIMVEEYEGFKLGGLVLTSQLPDPTGYGRVVKAENDKVLRIVEEKDASHEEKAIKEVNSGIYMFYAPYLLSALFKIRPNEKTGELYLTDVVEFFVENGHEIRSFMASDPIEVLGVNTRWELALAENVIKLKLVRFWAERGVTVHSPETVWIEPDVSIGEDVEIYPGAILKGKTKIGKGSVVGAGSVIENSEIGERVEVQPYSVIRKSKVDNKSIVGPFAHIREKSYIGEKSHIGNFVEVKKSKIGDRVNAKHLSYLGDAQIGDRVNIGAGVITANYDGKKKHKTKIGDKAFIGSNSLLIAPIEVGKLSYVAGGSVISKDVPAGALVVERAELKVFEGKGEAKIKK